MPFGWLHYAVAALATICFLFGVRYVWIGIRVYGDDWFYRELLLRFSALLFIASGVLVYCLTVL
jgi:hypothetical protein